MGAICSAGYLPSGKYFLFKIYNKMNNIIYKEIGETINDKKFLTKDIEITSRQINYWKERNIIPFLEKEKRGTMNMPEALWLMIINELSNIGIDSKKLETLSYNIWLKPFYEKYADKTFEYHLNKKGNSLNDEDKGWLKHFLENEQIMIDVFRKVINPFTDCIKDSLISNRTLYSFIYCPSKEEFIFSKSDKILRTESTEILTFFEIASVL